MSIAFHQAAKNSAGILFRFGIFIGLWALSTLLTCRASSVQGQKRHFGRRPMTSGLPSKTDLGEMRERVRLVPMHEVAAIGIGGSLAAPPLPHHRAYGSVHGGSRSCANTIGTRMAGRAI